MTSLVLSSWLDMIFLLLSRSFSSARELLVTTRICMPLLHAYGYGAMLMVVVVYDCCKGVRLSVVSFLWKAWTVLPGSIKASQEDGSL